jgi:hypothetical protein
MGVGRLNIWISDVADACGTSTLSGRATIFDCDGILAWPCGRFRTSGTDWQIVPQGTYRNLPFRCGHLEAEVPPGCYWVVAGSVLVGARVLAARGEFDRQTVERLAKTVEGELLAGVPLAPGDRILEEVYADFIETGGQKAEEGTKGKKK